MIQLPMIEVSVSDAGDVTYRVRTTLLTTLAYGIILANLAQQMALMLAEEGGNQDEALRQIVAAFHTELEKPQPLQQMQ